MRCGPLAEEARLRRGDYAMTVPSAEEARMEGDKARREKI
jgi:hypothetical protein